MTGSGVSVALQRDYGVGVSAGVSPGVSLAATVGLSVGALVGTLVAVAGKFVVATGMVRVRGVFRG